MYMCGEMETATAAPLMHVLSFSSSKKCQTSSSKTKTTTTSSAFSFIPPVSSVAAAASFSSQKYAISIPKLSLELYLFNVQQNLLKFKKNLQKMASSSTSTTSTARRSIDFQDKIKFLNSTCDNLLNCLNHGKIVKIERVAPKVDVIYDKHISHLHDNYLEYRNENGLLKHRLAEIDTKICTILNENDYLRWENEQYKLEIDGLRKSLDDENLLTKELKAEIRCFRLNQDQINHIHSVRLKEELSSARDISKTIEESSKRKFEDYELETKLKEMELKKKIECLEEELSYKSSMVEKYGQKIEYLTNENYRISQVFNKTKSEMEEQIEQFYLQESALETELSAAMRKLANLNHEKLMNYQNKNDTDLNQNMPSRTNNFLFNEKLKEASDWQNLLNEKTLQISDLRERLVFMEEECRLVKEENEYSNSLLTQMGKDMRILLDAAKDAKT